MRMVSVLATCLGLALVVAAGPCYAQLLTGYQKGQTQDAEPWLNSSVNEEPADSRIIAPTPGAILSAPKEASLSASRSLTAFGASESSSSGESAPVDLQADSVSYDEQSGVVMASGNVMMVQDGRILRADEIRYFLQEDKVRATGNVVLNEVNGDIHLSQVVEFNDKLKNGFVEGLQSYLSDGSRFTAKTGERRQGNQTYMNDAIYSACEPCKNNPDARLPWRFKASEVHHDEEAAKISYKNARFEVLGVPVAYTPYFSHSDGSIKRKSGFLTPSFGYRSNLGAFVENSYYYDIAPDKDATFGVVAMSQQSPLGLAQYRQRWNNAGIELNGGLTYSDRVDSSNGNTVFIDDELRGHLFGEGLWDMNDKWRSGFDLAYVSDDQYANQYEISNEDVLENRLYAERFSGRNYALAQMKMFQDIRTSDLQVEQPELLPELYASFIGKPGDIPGVGGRWDLQLGMLNLVRDQGGQDMSRISADAGWERRLISDYGLVSDIDLSVRGDTYFLNDRDLSLTGATEQGGASESRFFPQMHVQTSYPVARSFETMQMRVQPLVALTAAPKIEVNEDIPNEDSQDVQIDSSNLFSPNRFPGLDVVEDQTRATYGLLTGFHGNKGSSAEVFVGQSYRFDNTNNPFSAGSGLDQKKSDIVGYVNANYKNRYRANYRFQVDNDDLTYSRNELDVSGYWDKLSLSANYLFAEPLEGTEIDEDREQLSANMGYYFNKQWQFRSGAIQDLGADPGLRRFYLGLDYFGQCVFFSFTGQRNLTQEESGESSTSIFFRVGLKNISDFETSGLRQTSTWE